MKHKASIVTALFLATSAPLHAAHSPQPGDKPNVLFIISDDQGYSDFGFTGNKLVSMPNPELFRMAISGHGSPKPNIADVKQRKFEDHHLILRGPRFKYHALPGGKAALYDLEADPGETTDVQSKHPEVTATMAKQCRQRWDEIIKSGRSFVPEPKPALKPATTPKAKP
jgi:hypothetical protein